MIVGFFARKQPESQHLPRLECSQSEKPPRDGINNISQGGSGGSCQMLSLQKGKARENRSCKVSGSNIIINDYIRAELAINRHGRKLVSY